MKPTENSPTRTCLDLSIQQDTKEVTGHSGTVYQLEFQAVWDGKKDGNLRIIGAIDDGGLRAFIRLTEDFILTPDGSFVGE